jgi:hypothetical protein
VSPAASVPSAAAPTDPTDPGPADPSSPAEAVDLAESVDPVDPADPAAPADWLPVLTALYDRRAEAFATASGGPLAEVWTPGSAQLAADRDSVSGLAAAGEVLRGFAPAVVGVTAASVGDDRAELSVVDTRPGYDVVAAGDPGGPALRSDPGRPEAAVRIVLLRTDAGWRIDSAQLTG